LCSSKKASVAMVLEDDTMATDHFVEKFMKYYKSIPDSANYMDMKLFYPEYYCGFGGFKDILGFVVFAPLAGSVLTFFALKLLRGKHNSLKILIWIYFTGMSVYIPLTIGRQNIFWCYKFGIHPFEGTAFTNAVAYPAEKMDIIAAYLESHMKEKPVDLLLDRLSQEKQWTRYLLVPNLFQHIGVFSSNVYKNQGNDLYLKTSMTFVEMK